MPRRNTGARLRWIDRRQSYYIVWYERGRERLRATGETDERRAEEALAAFIRKNQRPIGGPRPAHEVTLGEVLDYYGRTRGRFAKDPARIGYAIDALLPFWATSDHRHQRHYAAPNTSSSAEAPGPPRRAGSLRRCGRGELRQGPHTDERAL
jgi:hypothetical protein